MIWGIRFHKEQFEARGKTLNLRLRYAYYVQGLPSNLAGAKNPVGVDTQEFTTNISPSDVDANGVYYFTDADGSPASFVASSVVLYPENDYLNLDFIGTWFDFPTASTGKHSDGLSDNWYNTDITGFWITGDGVDTQY